MADLLGCALIGWHISLPLLQLTGHTHTQPYVRPGERTMWAHNLDCTTLTKQFPAEIANITPLHRCQTAGLFVVPAQKKIKYDGVQRRKMFLKAKPLNCTVCAGAHNTHTHTATVIIK